MPAETGTPPLTRHLVHDGRDLAIATLVVIIVLAGGGTWIWGQAAGLIGDAAWPPVTPAQTLAVLGRLPHHFGDPAAAWPSAARSDLPGPILFYLSGVVTFVSLVALGWWIFRALARWRRRDTGFANRQQLTTALAAKTVIARGPVVRPSLKGRSGISVEDVGVRLGVSVPDGVDLAASAEDSCLVFAAPRQGKTSQIVIPWLTSWPGAALVTSIRLDVLLATAGLRRGNGPVAVMAPTGMVSWPDVLTWSPTDGCRNLDKARQRAEVMVTVGKSEKQDSSNAGYFGANATNLLALWLHAAALADRPMTDVLTWALDDRDDTPIKLLRDYPDAAAGTANLLDGLYRTPIETKSGLWTTVQTALAPLLSPTAQATFCPRPGRTFDIETFLRRGGTVYLLVSDKQASALAPLIAAFTDELIEVAKRLADHSPGGRLDPPLGLLLDEIANVVPLPSLPALMSFSGGSGIFLTAVFQSRAQAEARWGKDQAAMLWGAATIRVILGGLAGEELRQLSELVGEYEQHRTSYTRGDDGQISVQSSIQDKHVLTPEQVRTLDPSRREALVIHATTPAVKVRMTRHYEGPRRGDHARAEQEARRLIAEAERRRHGDELIHAAGRAS